MKTATIRIGGSYYVQKIVEFLIDRSAWFEVTPCPDFYWEIKFDSKNKEVIRRYAKNYFTDDLEFIISVPKSTTTV